MRDSLYKLVFFVPPSHVELVKGAVFSAGAGRQGDYEQCSWQCLGEGQFKPLPGAKPFAGEVGQLSRVYEYRVEMLCERLSVSAVIAALKQAHPYEEPAYELLALAEEPVA